MGGTVVVLGASNVSRGLGGLVGEVRDLPGGPHRLLCAHGHGRSYGLASSFLGRTLPAILECGLWRELRTGEGEVKALVTDLGNDLAYGVPAPTIVTWARTCVERLAEAAAEVTVVLPPRRAVLQLSRWRFQLFKALFFPGRELGFDQARRGVVELDDGLRRLAEHLPLSLLEPESDWYGVDPIHLRRSWRRLLWRSTIAGSRSSGRSAGRGRIGPDPALRFPFARPERCRWLGAEVGRRQPARHYSDGTVVSFF